MSWSHLSHYQPLAAAASVFSLPFDSAKLNVHSVAPAFLVAQSSSIDKPLIGPDIYADDR